MESALQKVLKAIEEVEIHTNFIKALEKARVDVAEFYSPPRVTTMGKSYGLRPGEAMDLTNGWDFTLERHRDAAIEYVKKVKPRLVTGSPECTMFSSLQNLDKKHRGA